MAVAVLLQGAITGDHAASWSIRIALEAWKPLVGRATRRTGARQVAGLVQLLLAQQLPCRPAVNYQMGDEIALGENRPEHVTFGPAAIAARPQQEQNRLAPPG